MGVFPPNAMPTAIGHLSIGLQLLRGADPLDEVLIRATDIRKSLEQLKDPQVIKDMVADFAGIRAKSAWNRSSQGPSREGCLVMNVTRG